MSQSRLIIFGKVTVAKPVWHTVLWHRVRQPKSDSPCKKVIEALLRADANIRVKDYDGVSAYSMVISSEWLTKDTNRFEILKMFLERANNLNLFTVLSEGGKEVIEALLKTNVDLYKIDSYGKTLIHALARNSNPDVIEQLRDMNFDVNARDKDGRTPLMMAAEKGNVNAVEFLLSKGADIDATNNDNKSALYLAIRSILHRNMGTDMDKIKRTVQVLLEHGANAQIKIHDYHYYKTIFDLLSKYEDFQLAELVLAFLALRRALGMAITELIRTKINANSHFKSYFERCRQQLLIEIYPSVTLLNVLTASERKLEGYFRNEQLASKLMDFKTTVDYFDEILGEQILKANRMLELRKFATDFVCKLMKMDYDGYPYVADEIAGYLEKEEIEYLISIENEVF